MKEKVSIYVSVFEILATTFSHIFIVMKGCETIIANLPFSQGAIYGSKSKTTTTLQVASKVIIYSIHITVWLTDF